MVCREDACGRDFWVWPLRKCLVAGNLRAKQKASEKRSRKKNEKQLQLQQQQQAWWKAERWGVVEKRHRSNGN